MFYFFKEFYIIRFFKFVNEQVLIKEQPVT